MVNKKVVASSRTGSDKTVKRSGVVDPMMVSRPKARSRAAADTFLSNESSYNIDDLYDENGALIMDEADNALKTTAKTTTRKNTPTPAAKQTKNVKKEKMAKDFDEEFSDEFDISDDDIAAVLDDDDTDKKGDKKKLSKAERKKQKKAEKRRKKEEKKARRRTPLWAKITIVVLVLIIIGILGAGAYIYMILTKTSAVFEGNPMDIFIKAPLAKDDYGRTNILVFGTAEDDEGHGGAMLTDSILVISVDQERKIASTFSVPRDLWVNYTVPGEKTLACTVGYKGKINATYFCARRANGDDTEKASIYFSKKISEVTGLNIQYYVAVDFRVLRDVVNILGGIDVDVHATDERGIYDICMHNLKLNKGMNYNLNGDIVLDLARARNAKGGYGLANSNFDREINQQRIMNAIKAKALNVGILANPTKVLSILDSMGENIKTNVSMAEMGTFIDIVLGMEGDVTSIKTQKLFRTGRISNQSVVAPAGATMDVNSSSLYNYRSITLYLRNQIDDATKAYDKAQEDKKAKERAEASN
jgi:LCP family protein required for cell wall assembly